MPTKTPYSKHVSAKSTPQTTAIPGSTQVANSGGGFSWAIDCWKQLDRFLILGAEGGTYYIGEQKLVEENAKSVIECIKLDGIRAINRIVEISHDGRAAKNDPAIFCLALATCHGVKEVKQHAYEVLPQVCRIPTHLFHFAQYVDDMRGWGSGLRKAVARWFTDQPADKLAYALIKYQQRDGWSSRDLLRLAHPKQPSEEHAALFRWAVSGMDGLGARQVKRKRGSTETEKSYPDVSGALPLIVRDFAGLSEKSTIKDVLPLIEKHNLPHEAVPTHLKTDPKLWEALLDKGMPLGAMLRNLANMTRYGTLAPLTGSLKIVTAALGDEEKLAKARIHPIAVLNALRTYARGRSLKGDGTWTPIQQIVDALDNAFYKTFKFVEPTGKNFLLGLDVSGSMTCGNCAGAEGLTPREGSAAMALVTAAVEANYHLLGFSHRLVKIPITPKMRLDQAIAVIEQIPMGMTDCSLPMKWARQTKTHVDTFCVYTDSETNYGGSNHAAQELQAYRREINPLARLVVIGMTGSKFTIADPNDAGMLDLVGFDTNAPTLIADFSRQ